MAALFAMVPAMQTKRFAAGGGKTHRYENMDVRVEFLEDELDLHKNAFQDLANSVVRMGIEGRAKTGKVGQHFRGRGFIGGKCVYWVSMSNGLDYTSIVATLSATKQQQLWEDLVQGDKTEKYDSGKVI